MRARNDCACTTEATGVGLTKIRTGCACNALQRLLVDGEGGAKRNSHGRWQSFSEKFVSELHFAALDVRKMEQI